MLPIKGSGIHQDEEYRNAIREYLELLEANPGDMTARWLLNVACMTVGEHPEKVPERWLIPPEKFAPTGTIPRFENIASTLDFGPPGLAGGVVMDDFNNDGSLIFSSARQDSNRSAISCVTWRTRATAPSKTERKRPACSD